MNSFWNLEWMWEEVLQQLQFNQVFFFFFWANHYFIKFACRDINAKLKLYAVIKIRAQFKTAQLAKFLLCRDINFLSRHTQSLVGQVIPCLRQ